MQRLRTFVTLQCLEEYHYHQPLMMFSTITQIFCILLVILKLIFLICHPLLMVHFLILVNTCMNTVCQRVLKTQFQLIVRIISALYLLLRAMLLPLFHPHILMYSFPIT